MFEAIGNIELKSIGLSSDAAANAQNLINRADSGEFKGEKGDKSYLHVAYADSSDGVTGFSLVDSINKLYIGQYADYISSPSEDPTMYRWTLIKGDKGNTGAKGDTGISVVDMVDEWYLSSSSSDKKGGSWSTIRSEWQSGRYFWRRIKTSYSDGSTSYSPSEDGYFDSVITNSVADSAHAKETANTANTTASNANTTANAAKSTADNANSKIDNMQIGGRNLIPNSKKELAIKNNRTSKEKEVIYSFWFNNPDGLIKGGTTVTLSADIKTNGHVSDIEFFVYDKNIKNVRAKRFVINPETYQRMSATFTTGSNVEGEDWSRVCARFDNNGTDSEGTNAILYVRNPKLELGNKATDWTPAPEDVEATTDQLRDDLNSTESALNTQINEVSKKTDSTNSALNEARDELSKRIADTMAQAQMAAAAAKVAQTDLNNYKSMTVDPQLKTMSDFMAKYNLSFRQDSTGLYITNQNADGTTADISLRLGNDRISFIQGTGDAAYEVAFISNNQLYITSGEFLKGLRLGNYALIPGANGNLSCKKVK